MNVHVGITLLEEMALKAENRKDRPEEERCEALEHLEPVPDVLKKEPEHLEPVPDPQKKVDLKRVDRSLSRLESMIDW